MGMSQPFDLSSGTGGEAEEKNTSELSFLAFNGVMQVRSTLARIRVRMHCQTRTKQLHSNCFCMVGRRKGHKKKKPPERSLALSFGSGSVILLLLMGLLQPTHLN